MKQILTILLLTILVVTGCTIKKDEVTIRKTSIAEISKIPNFELPDNIHESQLKKSFKWGNIHFVTVIKQVFWYPLPLPEEITRPYFSGILAAKDDDDKWEVFLEIKEKPDKNIPLYFWNEGNTLFMSIEDGNGAGSGEGILKLLKSTNSGKTWETKECYYAVGTNLDKYTKNSVHNHATALKQTDAENNPWDNPSSDPGHWYFMTELTLDDKSCHNFTIETNNTSKVHLTLNQQFLY